MAFPLHTARTNHFPFLVVFVALTLSSPCLSLTLASSNLSVHKMPLRLDDASPFSFAASSASDLQPHQNFLSTQVWPASRAAAFFLERNLPSVSARRAMTMCELGCGPGLPSLTAAAAGVGKVIATDLEPLALELVSAAAYDQDLIMETRLIDLCGDEIPEADLYVLADVFESRSVAKGAARLLHATTSSVWVFCQSDRAQRDIFRDELRSLLGDNDLDWIPMRHFDPSMRICLFDVDEGEVWYA